MADLSMFLLLLLFVTQTGLFFVLWRLHRDVARCQVMLDACVYNSDARHQSETEHVKTVHHLVAALLQELKQTPDRMLDTALHSQGTSIREVVGGLRHFLEQGPALHGKLGILRDKLDDLNRRVADLQEPMLTSVGGGDPLVHVRLPQGVNMMVVH